MPFLLSLRSLCRLAILATVFGAVTFALSRDSLENWLPPTWVDLTTQWREILLYAGPPAAVIGAVYGGSHRSIPFHPPLGRTPWSVMLRHLFPPLVAIELGVLMGLLPLAMNTAVKSTGGSPQYLVVLTSAIQLAAVCGLGYLAGLMFHSRLTPVAVGFGVGLWMLAIPWVTALSAGTDEFGRSYYSVGLIWLDFRADYGQFESTGSALARAILFAVLAAASYLAIAEYLDRGRDGLWGVRLASFFVVPVVASVALIAGRPSLIEASDARDCATSSPGVTVCVPPEVNTLLDPLSLLVSEAGDRFGFGAIQGPVRDAPLSDVVPFTLRTSSLDEFVRSARAALAFEVSGVSSCTRLLMAEGRANVDQEMTAAVLAATLLRRLGANEDEVQSSVFTDSRYLAVVDSMDDGEIRAYLRENGSALADCSASLVGY